ncbi:hypothetical protein HKX48_006561 [Thoreauomyces humboldtii]|nr:hypothetical protein HKX48_006561 [Thoreauomyces humboldtii]
MGPRYRPFLRYLHAAKVDEEQGEEPAVQEQRMDWLTALLKQNLALSDRMRKAKDPHPDMALSVRVDELAYDIMIFSVTIVQAMWRGRRYRRRIRMRKGAARTIQRWWKLCLAGHPAILALREKKQVAAGKIQQAWKDMKQRRAAVRKPEPLLPPSPITEITIEPPPRPITIAQPPMRPHWPETSEPSEDDVDGDPGLDEWLEGLDDKKEFFCGEETLMDNNHLQPVDAHPHQKEVAPWPTGADPEAENFLRHQFESMVNDPKVQRIQPRSPMRNLLLSRGVVRVPKAGEGTFGHILYEEDEVPHGRFSGLTGGMLMSRRWEQGLNNSGSTTRAGSAGVPAMAPSRQLPPPAAAVAEGRSEVSKGGEESASQEGSGW